MLQRLLIFRQRLIVFLRWWPAPMRRCKSQAARLGLALAYCWASATAFAGWLVPNSRRYSAPRHCRRWDKSSERSGTSARRRRTSSAGVGDSQIDAQQRIVGSRLLRFLQLVEGLVVVSGAQIDGGDQEVRGRIVVVQASAVVAAYSRAVSKSRRVAINLGQRLQDHGIVRAECDWLPAVRSWRPAMSPVWRRTWPRM